MRRATVRGAQPTLTLFPFLAVLICTMGALIMLLVLVMEQARSSIHLQTPIESAVESDVAEQLRVEKEDQQWRCQVLQQQREELREQLRQQRDYLAHLEDHLRELEQQLRSLPLQAQQLQQLHQQSAEDHQALQERQRALQKAVAEAQAALDEARRQAAQRRASYAIVPYPGPNGTTRRPIYVECTADAVIFRPENVVLRAEDFEDSVGPGNPFDAALRAAAKYLADQSLNRQEQPYPLLIVRPDGVMAYAAARQAMAGWEDEFGYELVSADLSLHFPPENPQLRQLLQQAIDEARLRQAALRRAMPTRTRGSGFVVSSHQGGVIPLDGTPLGPARRAPSTSAASSSTTGKPSHDVSRPAGTPQQTTTPAATVSSATSGAPGGAQSFGALRPLATSRGSNWALDKRTTGTTAYRRPVRVVCQREALILMPEAGTNEPPLVLTFGPDPVATVDQFVAALRNRVQTWGLPPLGGHWKPRIIADVAADAEHPYRLLVTLLDDSGLEWERTTP